MLATKECDQIIEFSFNSKQKSFVIRFLDGSSYLLKISDLPRRLIGNSPDWNSARADQSKTALLVNTSKEVRVINAKTIHNRGKVF